MVSKSLFAASLFVIGGAVQAETGRRGFSLGPSVSTLGVGGEAGYRFNDKFGIRANAQGFGFDGSGHAEALQYDYKVRLFTAGGIADYYPKGGGFRLSAGGYYNGNKIDLMSQPIPYVYRGRRLMMPAGTVTGHGRYNRFAPYAGLGYDGTIWRRLKIGGDLGVLFQGSAKVETQSTSPLVPKADIAHVRDDAEHAMNKVRFYPVARLKLTYRF